MYQNNLPINKKNYAGVMKANVMKANTFIGSDVRTAAVWESEANHAMNVHTKYPDLTTYVAVGKIIPENSKFNDGYI